MRFRILAALAVAAGLIFPGLTGPAAAQVVDPTAVIPTDPAARQGVLPNGLRYALMSNDRPVGGVSIRLRFDVGSYEESDEYRGVAHFLEHMAFNGTRDLPEGELTRRFAEAGVAFGRDQNASTSSFNTTYELDLPKSDDAALSLAFAWMRDIGDGMLLTPDAVARERGVILAEHDTRLGPAHSYREAYQAFAAPNARSRVRMPIGTPDTIRAIDAAALSAFHSAWYRPDNAMLSVVGDLPLDALEALVRDTFGDWTAPETPMVRAEATALDVERPLDVLVYPDATLGSSFLMCRVSPWTTLGPDSFARRRANITRGLWEGIVNRRLQLLSQGADAPFTAASVFSSPWTREANSVCANVGPPVGGAWRRAVSVVLEEVRRLETYGVEPREIARIVDAQKRSNASAVAQIDDRYSSTLAAQLLAIFPPYGLDPGSFVNPRDSAALYDAVVATITPADIQADFTKAWNGSEPLISARLPQPPGADALRDVWREVMDGPRPEARPVAEDGPAWAYADFGAPGAIVSRETIPEPEFTRVRFENGVILNLKSVAYTRDLVQMAVVLGDGRAGVANTDVQAAGFATAFVYPGGLGRHSLRQIQDLFPDSRIGLGLQMLADGFQLYGTTRPADLSLQLQLTAAMLSDPGFRDDLVGQRKQTIDLLYRSYRTQPGTVLSLAFAQAIAPDSPRVLPPREAMDALTMADFERLYRPVLTQAPLEVTVVGDMDENEVIGLVAATLGALPARTAGAGPRNDVFLLRYGDARPRIEVTHEGAADQAAFWAIWPLFVSDPSRRREQRALELVRAVLENKIRDEVREVLGATYSPAVGLSFEDAGDQGILLVGVATSPTDVDRVREAVRRVVNGVATGGIDQSDLDNVRTPVLARIDDNRATTGWWYGVLNGSAREPQKLRDALEWEVDYRDMTLDELKTVAATWLSGEAIEGVALPASSPAAPAP